MNFIGRFVLFLPLFLQLVDGKVDLTKQPAEYGVDCSYPIHHGINQKECPYFYEQYEKIMKGCAKEYSKEECEANEKDRLRMNRDQPKVQHNYTVIGFKHMKVPQDTWAMITNFYNQNKDNGKLEKWYRGNTIVNTWESPSSMISFENSQFRGGNTVKGKIWESVQPIIEEWVGRKVEPTSLYGIRVYKEGSILATHVDRLPLVSSAIINVAQDVDEDWPVEVYDHSGRAHNVTMAPGDMVLYESATVLHGRPFPMKGRFYANIFVHYQPIDHEANNEKDAQLRNEPVSVKRRHGGGPSRMKDEIAVSLTKEQLFMRAAATGDSDTLHMMLAADPKLIHHMDENNWEALHEAIRAGQFEEVKYLVEQGGDIGAKVRGGGPALWLARKTLSEDDPIINYLIGIGAPEN